ncbi:Gldg family protein [Pedobacter sp. MC2016-14]|uniref:Gldg family protein n=1 Tax=Pedobacter sp. MC2016-14 TaxID=2897327 RepID=UPI001E3477E7|nr:Gldg family protein [Pedobacter sp. MC2016-14]MCD0490525.1 Gldg family protein [Pedobacter sp. MC2016-14]
MKKILKIAKLELSILFYSPVAWLVLAIFMIQCGISFLDNLQGTNTGLQLGYGGRAITSTLFGGTSGLFTTIQGNLYLYLPILTMGLMSRETNSGSIKLLLSSPVKLREIIIGKYLAIIGYGLMLILILAIYGVIGLFSIEHVDLGSIFSGLLGLYMLICTYAAIGLFMSCLTTYQVVAAISTLAVFAVLRFVGTLGQNIDFVRDLTYFLSISGRTDKMIAGLITTKDVLYYLIIIASFLTLCVLRLKSERELKPWSVKAGRYTLLIVGALFLGYLSSRPLLTGYLDATNAKSLTLTKNSQEIAAQIDGELKVTTYANMLAPQVWDLLPASRNGELSRLERYKRFIPGLTMDYIYYYEKPIDSNLADYRHNPNLRGTTNTDEIANKMAENMDIERSLFLPSAQMTNLAELKDEGYLSVRKLEYKGKTSYLRFYIGDQSPHPGEAEFMAAVKRLVAKVPTIVFLTGNNERDINDSGDRGYQLLSAVKTRKNALINHGFNVDTLNLNLSDIPASADIVVLGDPTIALSATAQQKLSVYIQKGGNLFITGDPERREILNPVLQPLGVQLKNGTLVKPDGKFSPVFIPALLGRKGATLDSNLNRMARYEVPVAVQTAAGLDLQPKENFDAFPILMSPKTGWNRNAPLDPTVSVYNFNASMGDEQGAFPVAVGLSRQVRAKQQRIFVVGDADFISNAELSRPKRGENEYFVQGVLRWMTNGTFPLDVTRPDPKDLRLNISREQITGMMYLCKGILPALIAILGAIVLFKRRRN